MIDSATAARSRHPGDAFRSYERRPPTRSLMSNPRRRIIPGVPLHITQRGVDRCPTFLTEEDFAYYLWVLCATSVAANCQVHAYVLMTNHVHLLLTPVDASGPARLMRALGVRYVRYFNQRYGRTGTLWEGRFRSAPVETDAYFFACSRYIERNPQRAGLTDDPRGYHWSSFHRNACGEPDRVVTPHPLYTALGSDPDDCCRAYRRLFAADVTPETAAAVRTALPLRRGLAPSRYREAVAILSAEARGSGTSARAPMRLVTP